MENSNAHIFHLPLPLNKTKQPYMQLTSIQLPGVQTNLSRLQPVSQRQPATAIKPINPSAEDDYDWFSRQTINLYLSLPRSPGADAPNIMKKRQR